MYPSFPPTSEETFASISWAFYGFYGVNRVVSLIFLQLGFGFLSFFYVYEQLDIDFQVSKICCCYFLSSFLCICGFIKKKKNLFPRFLFWMILVGFWEVAYLHEYEYSLPSKL